MALAKIGESSIGPLIAAMQEHGERDFRRYAAAALGEIGIPAIEQMITAMGSDDKELRGFLSQALCRIGTPAIEPLRQRLNDADEIIRSCATLTLWQMGDHGVATIVEDARKDE